MAIVAIVPLSFQHHFRGSNVFEFFSPVNIFGIIWMIFEIFVIRWMYKVEPGKKILRKYSYWLNYKIHLPFTPYHKSGSASNWLGLPNDGDEVNSEKVKELGNVNNCPIGWSVMGSPDYKDQEGRSGQGRHASETSRSDPKGDTKLRRAHGACRRRSKHPRVTRRT